MNFKKSFNIIGTCIGMDIFAGTDSTMFDQNRTRRPIDIGSSSFLKKIVHVRSWFDGIWVIRILHLKSIRASRACTGEQAISIVFLVFDVVSIIQPKISWRRIDVSHNSDIMAIRLSKQIALLDIQLDSPLSRCFDRIEDPVPVTIWKFRLDARLILKRIIKISMLINIKQYVPGIVRNI
ncbi:hypothetical protein NL30_36270 [Burkholderia contaminans]|nr:hypothetical protein NL30_36270 [Burkholderia contaminans]